jgi:hypothetical protein
LVGISGEVRDGVPLSGEEFGEALSQRLFGHVATFVENRRAGDGWRLNRCSR